MLLPHQGGRMRLLVIEDERKTGEYLKKGLEESGFVVDLASNGIDSPGSASMDPFPVSEPLDGSHGVDVLVLESQADEARKLIAEYLKDNASSDSDDSSDQ